MSEEEILRKAKDFIIFMDDVIKNHLDYDYEENITAYEDKALVQGLLDLYNKEKEKNKLIWDFKRGAYMLGKADENKTMIGIIQRHYISKDKIKAKIEELEKEYKQFSDWDREDDCMITREEIDILEELLEESE